MIRPLFLLLGFIVSAIPAAGASELELRGISSARLLAGEVLPRLLRRVEELRGAIDGNRD